MSKIKNIVRNSIPLKLRILVGPYIAYIFYIFKIYILGNPNQPKVLSIEKTIDEILLKDLSVIRFGDGEMSIINNIDLGFQKKDSVLALRLKEIFQINNPKLLICIPGIFGKLNYLESIGFWFALHHLFKHNHEWKALLSPTQIYGDTFITRPYLAIKNKSGSQKIFEKLFSIWSQKNVVLIEGEQSRLGVGNNMFDNTQSIKRILCPSENAFEKYEQILNEAKKLEKQALILISLGPTAKVLAYDLFQLGYKVIDIGHIDMEYEMFLRKEMKLTKIPYKYFNEINERNPEDCQDPKYISQILATIK